MTATMGELWGLVQTGSFWTAFLQTARGWAIGLGLATLLAVPIGIVLGLSDLAGRAFRVPVEFLRPIPSAALIPLLFLTLGPTLQSEVFLAAFGAFWPILVQTMYGVRDVDPVAIDTARSFGVPKRERLWRITLPSAVPYIATGMRIASAVALILAFTAELFMGTPGLGSSSTTRSPTGSRPSSTPSRSPPARSGSARISCSRRSSAAPCAGTRRSGWRPCEGPRPRDAQGRGGDRRPDRDRRRLGALGALGGQPVLAAAVEDRAGVQRPLGLRAVPERTSSRA